MDTENENRTVSSNAYLYGQLKSLGVSANVWDDVLDEIFDEPPGNIPSPFGLVCHDLASNRGPKWLDYSRPEGISDHDYVRGILRQAIAEENSGDPDLPPDNGSDCDQVIEEYWAQRDVTN